MVDDGRARLYPLLLRFKSRTLRLKFDQACLGLVLRREQGERTSSALSISFWLRATARPVRSSSDLTSFNSHKRDSRVPADSYSNRLVPRTTRKDSGCGSTVAAAHDKSQNPIFPCFHTSTGRRDRANRSNIRQAESMLGKLHPAWR